MIFLSLFFVFSIFASDQNLVDYFQLLPREVLKEITNLYFKGYDDLVPSIAKHARNDIKSNQEPKEELSEDMIKPYGFSYMAICATNKSWYAYKYNGKDTIQEYGIKQKVLSEIARLLYNTPFIVLAWGKNFDATLNDKMNKAIESENSKFGENATGITKNLYGKLSDFLRTWQSDKLTWYQFEERACCILYDRDNETYEYIFDFQDQLDAMLTSKEGKRRKIIKLITTQIDFNRYYQELFNNTVIPTHCIYAEKYLGGKFLKHFAEKISKETKYSEYNLRSKFVLLACKILQYDIRSKHYIVISNFLNDLNQCCKKQGYGTILENMVSCKDYQATQCLLFCKMDPNEDGFSSVLCHAIIENRSDIVNLLLQYGANPNLLNRNGDSSLSLACLYGQEGIVKTLLKCRAHPDGVQGQRYVPLRQTTRVDIAELLLKYGANVNVRSSRTGETPLHYAAQYKQHCEFARFLLEHGANPLIPDNALRTPLSIARANGVVDTVKLFEDHLKKQEGNPS